MSYKSHFQLADQYIQHTTQIVSGITLPWLQQRYVGFVAITGVTAYELAIKEILVEFAKRKHNVFGVVVENLYQRINGRISLDDLRNLHISRFGDRYLKRFKKQLDDEEVAILRSKKRSIKSSYGNLITWRHSFIHAGQIPGQVNYTEAVKAYEAGKSVIEVLARSMVR